MTPLQRAALVVILLVAAVLRLTGLDWDDFQHHHPDERYITWVATTIEFPPLGRFDRADWQPETSTFNPFHWPPEAGSEGIVVLQGEPRDFAYGHVPLYLGVLATRLAERIGPIVVGLAPPGWPIARDVFNGAGRIEFHHLAAAGRALTALFDVGTVLLLFLLGHRVYGPAAGLLAAAFVALMPLHIQQAHFFTSDPYLTFFVVAGLYAMVSAQQALSGRRRLAWLLLAAAAVGLAIGSKFNAVLLFVPLLWVSWGGQPARRAVPTAMLALAVAVAVFALTNPFALLDRTCPVEGTSSLGPITLPATLTRSCYLQNVAAQSAMVRGSADLGFTRQYEGTRPYLYFIEMQIRWGMGPALGLLAFAGLVWVVVDAVRRWKDRGESEKGTSGKKPARTIDDPVITLLLWVVPYFILTGSFYVKFMRYMQPIAPFLALFAAAMLWRWRRPIGRAVAGAVLVLTLIYAVAFVSLYGDEHPWNSASRWIHENVPPGTTILSEQWDDYLPVTMTMDGERRRREDYRNVELTWLSSPDAADNEAKLMGNLEKLAAAEYLTVVSNRVYSVVARQAERYPLSSQYPALLFDGALGYELIWVGGRAPQLFGVTIRPDVFAWPALDPPAGVADYLDRQPAITFGRVDESFVVYDQPLTMIFRNTGHLTAVQMRDAFTVPSDP